MIRDPGHGQEGSASLSFFVRLDCRIFFKKLACLEVFEGKCVSSWEGAEWEDSLL